MTLGELFIKIGFKPDAEQLKNAQAVVQKSANAIQARAGLFKQAGTAVSNGLKSIGTGIKGFFAGINSNADKLSKFMTDMNAVKFAIIAAGAAIVGITKKASDYAAELLRVNSVTGISTQTLQALQQQAALSGVEADEVNNSLKEIQRQAIEISQGRGNLRPWALLGINPNEDPIKVLGQLGEKLRGMSPARGAMFAQELGQSDKMISFLKEAQSLGSSDRSLLLSDKEIKKLKDFNIFFNRAWDGSKRMLQKLGVTLMPVATFIINSFERIVRAGKDIARFFEWFGDNFKMITKVLLIFAGIVGVALYPMTAIFIGLALAIEDVLGWMRGDKSVTGAILGPFKEFEETTKKIVENIKGIGQSIKDLMTIQGWKDLFKGIGITAQESFDSVKDMKPLGQSNIDKYAAEDAKKGTIWQQLFGGKPPENNVTINVNGAGDPSAVAKETVNQMNSNTQYQQPVGVK